MAHSATWAMLGSWAAMAAGTLASSLFMAVTTSRAVIRSRSMVAGLRVSVVMLSKLIPNALSFPSVRFCGLYRPGGAGRTVYRRPFPDRDGGLYRTDCIVVSYFFFVN